MARKNEFEIYEEKELIGGKLRRKSISLINDPSQPEDSLLEFREFIDNCIGIVKVLPEKMIYLFPESFPKKYGMELLTPRAQQWLNHINLGIGNFVNELSDFIPILRRIYYNMRAELSNGKKNNFDLAIKEYKRERNPAYISFTPSVEPPDLIIELDDDLLESYLIEKELTSSMGNTVEMLELIDLLEITGRAFNYLEEEAIPATSNLDWFWFVDLFKERDREQFTIIIDRFREIKRILINILIDFNLFTKHLYIAVFEGFIGYVQGLFDEIGIIQSYIVKRNITCNEFKTALEYKASYLKEEEIIHKEKFDILFKVAILVIVNSKFPKRYDLLFKRIDKKNN